MIEKKDSPVKTSPGLTTINGGFMIKFASIIIASALAFNAQAADNNSNDPRYFQLIKVKMTDVTAQYENNNKNFAQAGLFENCQPAGKPLVAMTTTTDISNGVLNPLDVIEVTVDRIINIGKKMWTILDAGRPVVNVTTYTANALPHGLTCWSDLSGWNIPETKTYKVAYENAFGIDVVTFDYRVTYTAGGSLNGQGKYITNATITPAALNVSWGFELNAQAEVPSVFNRGTNTSPVAGMQMLMKWQVKSVMSQVEQAETFYVGGDNMMKHLE